MRKKMLLALLLAASLLLSGCSLIAKDEKVDNARPVLQVGDIIYNKGQVQAQVDMQLQYTQMIYNMYLGQYLDITDPEVVADAREMVIQSLTQEAVIAMKARERGLDALTADEQSQLEQAVQNTWQEYRDSAEAELALSESAASAQRNAAIDAALEKEGVSLESIRASETLRMLDEKLQSDVIRDVVPTDADIQSAFDAKVEDAKAAYASNPSAYGADVLNGGTVYYRPAGYRNVKQILIRFSDADESLIQRIESAVSNAQQRENTATAALTDLGVTDIEALASRVRVKLAEAEGPTDTVDIREVATSYDELPADDIREQVRTLAEARAMEDFFIEQLALAKEQALANISAEADGVLASLAAGEDWDALCAAHNDDPGMMAGAEHAQTGYPVCAGFTQFDPAFVDAAMALTAVGGWSDKTPGGYGYYIIQYASDVTEGPVALEDVRDEVYEDALVSAQDAAYNAALDQWIAQADVKIDLRPLDD